MLKRFDMKFRNNSKALFVGVDIAGGDPNCEKVGIPVRIQPGKSGSFSVINKGVELAVSAGILTPLDKEAKELFREVIK